MDESPLWQSADEPLPSSRCLDGVKTQTQIPAPSKFGPLPDAQPNSDSPPRILAAIRPDERLDGAELLLRAAHRLAGALKAKWTVVSVETSRSRWLSASQQDSRTNVFRLAESLGAETASIQATSPPEALLEYAKLRGARTLVVGVPCRRSARPPFRPSIVEAFIRGGSDVDVVMVARPGIDMAAGSATGLASGSRTRLKRLCPYAAALGLTALCSTITVPMLDHFDLVDISMVYMLGATFAALFLGLGPAVCGSLANIAAFDYFIVPPRRSFFVTEPRYFVTFGVMLGVSIVIAKLVSAVRVQTTAAAARERRTAALYSISRQLAVTRDAETMAAIAERHIAAVWQSSAVVRIRDNGRLNSRQSGGGIAPDTKVCEWVIEHRQRAGLGAEYFGADSSIYLPLIGSEDVRGVLIVNPSDPRRMLVPEQSRLLEALAGQLALALERVRLAEAAQSAHLAAERATLRNTLLASISHDLRTPLSAIAGAGSMMAHDSFALDEHRRTTLGRLIEEKARDMTELLTNVLELMRLESGAIGIKREWHALEDLIGLTLRKYEGKLGRRRTIVDIPDDFPMMFVEGGLIVQMLSNLIDNCTKYTPPETEIVIAAGLVNGQMVITVEDSGPGLSVIDPDRLFEKFERGNSEGNVAGVGLGLAICRAVSRLHSGDIRATPAESGGACFVITLPVMTEPQQPTQNADERRTAHRSTVESSRIEGNF
jgi:two-component system, OmpR family, sensor histidine kinase KdpD